jgi:hypothetical protein
LRNRLVTAVVVFVGCVLLSGCGTSSAPSPTPTPPAPTLTSVTVSCSATTIQYEVSTTQCAATAHYSDGVSAAETAGVTWQPSSPLAIVDSNGVVSTGAYIGSIGTVVITATFQGVSGTITLTVKSCNVC